MYIDIPDLLPLAQQSKELKEFLTESRPRINGSFYDRPLARSRLVSYGSIREKLKTLPDDRQPLLLFRREKPSALDKFLKEEFQLKTSEKVLFKVHSDGLAYKQKSTFVSPGSCYFILSRNTISINSLVNKQTVSCEDLHLYLVSLPKTISSEEETFLTSLGFDIKLGINIIPVGTMPAAWDEEGYIEFLADESPCLAVELDHEIEFLKLEFGDNRLEIANPDIEKPIFVNLPYLPVGSYEFSVKGKRQNQNDYEILGSAEIGIREPRPRQAATTSQNALLLFTDPFEPTFEQLFAGKVNFDFWTPPGTTATIHLALLSKQNGDNNLLLKKKLTTIALPDESCKFNSNILEALQDSHIREKSEDAFSCLLDFETGELGTVTVNFEREFLPIKWNVKADKNQMFLRLSDNFDSDEKISVAKYDFLSPDQKIIVPYDEVHEFGFPIPPSGGLYIAEVPQIKQGIVIMRQIERRSLRLDEIRQHEFVPKLSNYPKNSRSLSELINLYCLWINSVWRGDPLRLIDKNIISKALLLEIVSLIDDNHSWKKAEIHYYSGKDNTAFYLRKSVSSKFSLLERLPKVCDVPRVFSANEWVDNLVFVFGDDLPIESVKIPSKIAGGRPITRMIRKDWLPEFALRLCSRPDTLQEWAKKHYELGLEKMIANPTLVRAARYIVLTANRKSSNGHKNLPYTWDWE